MQTVNDVPGDASHDLCLHWWKMLLSLWTLTMLVAGLLATHAFLSQVTSSVTSSFCPGFSQIGLLTLFWLCLPLTNTNLGVAIDSVLVSLDSVVFSLDSSQSSVFMVPACGVDQGGTLKPANYPEGTLLMLCAKNPPLMLSVDQWFQALS